MHDLAIIFIYTNKDYVTNINLNSIIKNNPDIPIIQVNYRDYGECIPFLGHRPLNKWSVRDLWYSCDSIFLYWYLSSSFRARNYILVEWDTHCHNTSFIEFLGERLLNNTGMMSSKIINTYSEPDDVWFNDFNNKKLLYSLFSREHISKYSPMSCTTISDECVQDIVKYLQAHPLANKLYIETKFATIAKYLGYPINEYEPKRYDYITYHEHICENLIKELYSKSLNGIYHPVKRYNVYKKYFNTNTIQSNNNSNITVHHAIYGAVLDVTHDISFLVNNNVGDIIIDNNIAGDPAPFRSKKMILKYEKDGKMFEKVVNEGEKLDISSL